MRRFLFIMGNEGHRWGGSEPLWSQTAAHLARAGNEVVVSAKDWGEPIPQVEKLREAGCEIFYRTGQDVMPQFLTRQIRKAFPRPEYRLNHLRTLGGGADLVVISQGDNRDAYWWLEAARVSGLRYAIVSQGAAEQWWPDDNGAESLAACYKKASAAYFVSQGNLELSRRQFGSPLLNGKVVRNPFNVRYDAAPTWPETNEDELLLACVGRLDVSHKGQDLILQVLSLAHWRSRKIRVSLVGTGVNERWLRRAFAEQGLTNVEFLGFIDDIEAMWGKHHALLLPSRYEGMALALVEAMLCGHPAIITDVAGSRELVRDGVNGFLIKAATVELVDEAMNRAWESRARLKEMGATAAADVRKWVSRDPAEDFASELEALAGDGPGARK